MNIIISGARDQVTVALNDSKTARAIFDGVPLSLSVSVWGDEIYGEIPVSMPLEHEYAHEVVDVGTVAFWPEGSCFCVFFGPTPMSTQGEIRLASAVTVIGTVISDIEVLQTLKNDRELQITISEES